MADSSKTEQPTGKRLLKARTEGQFASSRELIAAANFLVFLGILGAWFPSWMDGMKQMLRQALAEAFRGDLTVTSFPSIAATLLNRAFVPLSILAVLTTLTTIAVNLAVTKMGFSFKKLMPDFSRLNPAPKVKNLATQGPAAVGQAAAMLIIFGSTIYLIAKQNAEVFLSLPFASLDIGLQTVALAIKDLLWKAAAVFLVFGIIDLFRQRRKYTKGLKMSKQEVKEEAKESEGNPHVKGKIRRMRRDLARRRMMKEVATATAVIVNPTHFAVALRYSADSAGTPVVVAKGKNYLALRIRQRAIENGVPLVENPPLARALYSSVEVGREIPPSLYKAVAEVLAYIYRLTHARVGNTRRRA
jgi:flagellar biosynthetic protein FlhB